MIRLCPNLLLIWILLWYKQDAEIVEWFSISGRMAEDRCLSAVITLCCACWACEESCFDFRTSCSSCISLKGIIRFCQVHARELHIMLFTMNDTLGVCWKIPCMDFPTLRSNPLLSDVEENVVIWFAFPFLCKTGLFAAWIWTFSFSQLDFFSTSQ